MNSDRPVTIDLESSPSVALKALAALFVGGLLLIVFLPALVSIADSPSTISPADAFQQLTGWQLPSTATVVSNSDTHGGLQNDGDYALTVKLQPSKLQSLLRSDQKEWRDCPIAPEIVREAWDLPDHSGTKYYAEKTMDSDSDWHRGYVVIVNPDTGFVWVYEWKS